MAQKYRVEAIVSDVPRWVRNTAQTVNAFFRELSETSNALTAGTTQTQVGAAQLTLGTNRVSTATSDDGVKLPFADAGAECAVRNDGGAAIKVWPHSGGSIDDGSTDAADANTLSNNSSRTYRAMTSTEWYTIGNS